MTRLKHVLLVLLLACLGLPAAALDLVDAEQQGAAPGEWRAVRRPTQLVSDGSGAPRLAVYRLAFTLPAQPETLWALRIDRLSNRHRLFLNGQLIHEQGADEEGHARPRLLPLYLPLAPALLKPGANTLQLVLQFGTQAALSAVVVGPDGVMRAAYQRDRLLDTTLPQLLNIGGAALATVLLLLWWRRRQEVAIGLFGALWLMASLRNLAYFVTLSPLPGGLSEWLFFCAQACTVGLLGLFAIALSGHPWPRLRRACLASVMGLPLLGLAAMGLGVLAALRLAVYPVLVLLGLASVGVLWRTLQGQRGRALALLVAGVFIVVGAGVHDYAYLHGWRPITEFFWLPFAVPVALAAYAAMLLGRLVRGMAEVEALSQHLEQRVAERTTELAAASQAKSRFFAAASHDMRQPVATIGLLLGLMGDQVKQGPPALSRLMAALGQAVLGLESLLRGLLDMARLEQVAVAMQPVAVQAVFDAVALDEQAHAQARGLRLRFRPTAAWVISDPLLLTQIVRNLVSNGLRYTEQGSVLVALRPDAAGGGWRLEVRDSGMGIAPAQQALIFDAFVQLASPQAAQSAQSAQQPGHGLGLAIVQRSAAVLGHGLGLRSAPGQGSCFSLRLQRAPKR